MNVYWKTYISNPEMWQVSLQREPEYDELSTNEIALVEQIFKKYKDVDRWTLAKSTHDLPEYHDPKGSAVPIDYRDILVGAGKTPKEVEEVLEEIEGLAFVENLLG